MAFDLTKRKVSELSDRLFAPREIFLRDRRDGFNFSVFLQMPRRLPRPAVVAVLCWTVGSTGKFVLDQEVLAERETQLEEQKSEYFRLLAEVSEYHRQFADITGELAANQSVLMDVLEETDQPAQPGYAGQAGASLRCPPLERAGPR